MLQAFRPTARTIATLYLHFGSDRPRILQIYNREVPIKRDLKGGGKVIGNDVSLMVYLDQGLLICLERSQIFSTSRLTNSDV